MDLYLNSGNINLLNYIMVPAWVMINSRKCFSNRITAGQVMPDIADLQKILSARLPGHDEFGIKIRDREIMLAVISHDESNLIATSIKYNDTPGVMVLSITEDCMSKMPEFINQMNSTGTIEKIIIVDDDPRIIKTYNSMLDMLGYRTDSYTSPVDALDSLKHNRYDLLISDYDMPAMNGFELISSICHRRPATPVILISGSARFQSGVFSTELKNCMISFMSKPVTMTDLTRSLEVAEFFYRISLFNCWEESRAK
jgi:CheY-like chemotaxis protein